MMNRNFFGDKEFYRTFLRLAVPVTLQYFMASSLNLLDNIMVGQLGAVELAAVGLANQVYFLLLLFLLGISGGASIFAAQFWGKKDIQSIRQVLGFSTIVSGSAAFFFFIICIINAPAILRIFSTDPAVIELGSQFLQITSVTYVLMAVTACFAAVLRSIGEVKLPMRVNGMALLFNTVLNYLLIFGNFGFPRLGVIGSGIATVVARSLEITILLTLAYRRKYSIAPKLPEMWSIPADLAKRFIRTTGTVVVKDVIWALGMVIYMAVYARMGTGVVAALNITNTMRQLIFVLFNGIASACMVMVGNQIGAGNELKAFQYARRFLGITIGVAVVVGTITISGSGFILRPYHISPAVSRDAKGLLVVFAAYLPMIVFNMVAIVGVLRSGGDTMFCLLLDLVAVYLIGMPLAFLGQRAWNYPVVVVYALVTAQEIFKFALCLQRFYSKRWIHNLVRDFGQKPAPVPEQV
ncbi:MAG: MATE family efflux transporter [Firmicutes bacterium]|nr:MATE family efflux transporter [Bacillota bacterium]